MDIEITPPTPPDSFAGMARYTWKIYKENYKTALLLSAIFVAIYFLLSYIPSLLYRFI